MSTVASVENRVGIVVIGRRNGTQLEACLASLRESAAPVAYVDAGSQDQNVALALEHGAVVVELDAGQPYSEARARNEGFSALLARHPSLWFVQFLDADCTLLPGWLDAATAAFKIDAWRAVVTGAVQEQRPSNSVYNRLCSMEGRLPAGDLTSLGALGCIMMVRAAVFERLGGFNTQVITGEVPEFGARVGLAHLKLTKIDAPMATHDAEIVRFRHWWLRTLRGGYAIGERFHLDGASELPACVHDHRSTMLWGVGLPMLLWLTAIPTRGASLLGLLAYGWLAIGAYRHRRRVGDSVADAMLFARYTVVGKIASGVGLLRFYVHRLARRLRVIESK